MAKRTFIVTAITTDTMATEAAVGTNICHNRLSISRLMIEGTNWDSGAGSPWSGSLGTTDAANSAAVAWNRPTTSLHCRSGAS
ncbi:MAG: hypothetical protein BZY77_07010 [SAR202 cluster bacterium Io17-Chloro-G5]|nr:MAG: hypothetical protein BZY77_07010 [SAR202 cluster bacterium Io17-Chloro-G5]